MRLSFYFVMMIGIGVMMACNDAYVPLPKAYPKMILPKHHSYTHFDSIGFPFQFAVPTYAVIEKDTLALTLPNKEGKGRGDERFWLNIVFPSFNATIHITYKSLRTHTLDQLIYEAFKLTNKQVYKASGIVRKDVRTAQGYTGVFFRVSGDAATAHQFFITDNKHHFLRGALYFNVTPNADSLQKATDFIFEDMKQLVTTTRFIP